MKIVIPKSLVNEISSQAVYAAKNEISPTIQEQFNRIKEEMISEFMNHPVTEEILGRENASNISGTLDGKKGNLFSFIGFEENDDPISPIIELLNETSLSLSFFKKIGSKATIRVPSSKDIFDATPMPWADGRSWAKGIETGISGIGYYIHAFRKGRSGGGLQTEKQISSGRFKNTKYISDLLNRYTKKFSNISGAQINIKSL